MKTNILFVIADLRQGGAESALLKVCQTLQDTCNIHVLTIKKQGQLVEKFEKICSSVNQLTNSKINFVLLNRFYKKTLNEQKLNQKVKDLYKDIEFTKIVAFLEGAPTYITNALKLPSEKKIAWIHTSIVEHNKILDYQNYDNIICCSNKVAKELKTININADVIYNLIDTDKILKMATQRVEMDQNEFNIVTVARFDKAKALERLIDVSKNLSNKNIKHHLYIVGYGRLYKKLLKLATSDNISIICNEKNVYKYMNGANLFVLASLYEGYGMVVDEALLLNKLVLVTKTNSVEAVGNGKFGLVCENNSNGIEKQIEYIIKNFANIKVTSKDILGQNQKIIQQIRELFEV